MMRHPTISPDPNKHTNTHHPATTPRPDPSPRAPVPCPLPNRAAPARRDAHSAPQSRSSDTHRRRRPPPGSWWSSGTVAMVFLSFHLQRLRVWERLGVVLWGVLCLLVPASVDGHWRTTAVTAPWFGRLREKGGGAKYGSSCMVWWGWIFRRCWE
ncbi:hypothetical protein BT67DRAFT_258320 [Trichocladium antarcticum]|uniref:Uncharacterized protein n=1 Tax=Trichocladium antarcticum TaxID=1450529 RepID=A0AAN6UMN7_9PEZI|nr:hypothetical protein BT67DRAFT_258320 [Trichocladium antarcticum]